MKRGKLYNDKLTLVEKDKRYLPEEAINLVKQFQRAKFSETVEVHFNLGIDPRQADQQLRGTLDLPHGTGKSITILAITQGEKEAEAKKAGADYVGSDDLIEKIQGGWLDFDLVVATPDMMSKVGKLGKLLGAKGLMPSPKSGTVTLDIGSAVKGFKAGKLEYRNDKAGIIHLIIGKTSFTEKQLLENFTTVYDILLKAKPTKSKGIYMKSISLSTTMSPGIYVEPMKIKWKEAS